MPWAETMLERTRHALLGHGDPERADGAARYMKHVAPFLGIAAPERRRRLRVAWADTPVPTAEELGEAAMRLIALPEREFHYAACDLLARYRSVIDVDFLACWVEPLLTTKPWWDTVDGFVSFVVAPTCRTSDTSALIDRWSASGDRWLVRAALGHQRGWKADVDVMRVLDLCARHWSDPEFFVAKAIGWALRDVAAVDAPAVRTFLEERATRNAVAEREAWRGIARADVVAAGSARDRFGPQGNRTSGRRMA